MEQTSKQLISEIKKQLQTYYTIEEIWCFIYIVFDKILNLSKTEVHSKPEFIISAQNIKQINNILQELKLFKPIEYILQETEFYGLKFKVDKNVLIPRPETEELVEWLITDNLTNQQKQIKILDIGTGSGCIAISLQRFIKNSQLFAIDISEKAINIAKENAKNNDVEINFKIHDILSGTEIKFKPVITKFDIIVSNPPYVRYIEKKLMSKNVLDYEPHTALFVPDKNSLVFYNAILKFAEKNLIQNGKLFFEINENLSNELVTLINKFQFANISLLEDINGKKRMVRLNRK